VGMTENEKRKKQILKAKPRERLVSVFDYVITKVVRMLCRQMANVISLRDK
jgi:hypothetical protein